MILKQVKQTKSNYCVIYLVFTLFFHRIFNIFKMRYFLYKIFNPALLNKKFFCMNIKNIFNCLLMLIFLVNPNFQYKHLLQGTYSFLMKGAILKIPSLFYVILVGFGAI